MNPLSSAPRLLLVSANTAMYSLIANLLADQPYQLHAISDGAEALTILQQEDPPEIALLDAEVPGLSALELAANVRRCGSRKQTWIILLASQADPVIVAAATDAGIDDLLLSAADGFNKADLHIRLGVAIRVQQHIHHLEAQAQAVSRQSLHDNLTGLWNRETILSLLFAETDRVQRMGTPLGFLLLDLDHFSRINAEHGYETGDRILQEMAARLRRYMRSYDLLGRCGDDEFLIALPGCNAHLARHLANRVRTIMLHKPFLAARENITLTASIGLSQSCGRSPLVVLREAERSLAAAKRDGRNCEREYALPHGELGTTATIH